MISSILSLVVSIAMIVFTWMIFVKAGVPGWASLIPFYSTWKEGTIATSKKGIVIGLIVCQVGMLLSMVPMYGGIFAALASESASSATSMYATGGFGLILFLLFAIACMVLSVILYIKLARAFGQETGFGVGLALLFPVFAGILALGDAQYQGPVD